MSATASSGSASDPKVPVPVVILLRAALPVPVIKRVPGTSPDSRLGRVQGTKTWNSERYVFHGMFHDVFVHKPDMFHDMFVHQWTSGFTLDTSDALAFNETPH